MTVLYGDGIHDDYQAIQGMLDSGLSVIKLNKPKVKYIISKTLKIHTGQTLKMPKKALISLMDNANCVMLENDDFEKWSSNITIIGGIWDMNHDNQRPNPYHFSDENGELTPEKYKKKNLPKMFDKFYDIYTGTCIRFCRVNNLLFKNVTIRNPVTYGIHVGHLNGFVFKDIFFDFFEGSPKLWNMDGLHISGSCKNGKIINIHGTCHDDMLAFTTDLEQEDIVGGIDNIVVNGIHGEHTHSAVRILSRKSPITNISITNITGSYYVYCIGFTKYVANDTYGIMDNISINKVSASSCEGTNDVTWHYPFIWIEGGLKIKSLSLSNIERIITDINVPFIQIDQNVILEGFVAKNISEK